MNYVEFEWDSTENFDPELPLAEWQYGIEEVGGHAVSAAGLPASYVVRSQETLGLTIRVLETEWAACRDFLRAGMAGTEIAMTVGELGAVDVFFVSPVSGETMTVERDQNYSRVLLVSVTVRASDGGDLDLLFYPEDS